MVEIWVGGERWEMTLTVNISKTKKYFQIPFFKLYWETAHFNFFDLLEKSRILTENRTFEF